MILTCWLASSSFLHCGIFFYAVNVRCIYIYISDYPSALGFLQTKGLDQGDYGTRGDRWGDSYLEPPRKPMSQWQELGIYELNIGSEGICISYISKVHIQYKYTVYNISYIYIYIDIS